MIGAHRTGDIDIAHSISSTTRATIGFRSELVAHHLRVLVLPSVAATPTDGITTLPCHLHANHGAKSSMVMVVMQLKPHEGTDARPPHIAL